jgi:hypothetical protein
LLSTHSGFIFPPKYLLCNSRRSVLFSACHSLLAFNAIYIYLLRLHSFETKLPASTLEVLYFSSKNFREINKDRQKVWKSFTGEEEFYFY